LLLLGLVLAAPADGLEPRVEVGKCLSAAGTLLNQEDGRPWHAVPEGGAVFSRDLLLALPGVKAVVEPRPASVHLTLWGNLPQLSSAPVLESAVILHDSRAFDLDFTLLRGRVVLTNRKEKGPARVWVRVLDGAGEVTLPEPGDEVALEIYGRWPRGTSFRPDAKEQDRPTTSLNILALKGQADVKAGSTRHRLSAPPGRAFFHWDSVAGPDESPERRDRLPEWADPKAEPPAVAKEVAGVVEGWQAEAAKKTPEDALVNLLSAAGDGPGAKVRREFAVLGLAALGEVNRVAEALADPERADTRRAAVIGLRHWIGEEAGRDQRLYQMLIDRQRYSKAQAETILQLLHSPFSANQPETYETLIAYLYHSKLAIRELAWWHLTRLVPGGAVVPYDPAASEAERARAAAAWKKHIPSGSLPPKEK
jgi:hypothetical protein